jgi:hypothetical protein
VPDTTATFGRWQSAFTLADDSPGIAYIVLRVPAGRLSSEGRPIQASGGPACLAARPGLEALPSA